MRGVMTGNAARKFVKMTVIWAVPLIEIEQQILQIILIESSGALPLGALRQLPNLASRSYATVSMSMRI